MKFNIQKAALLLFASLLLTSCSTVQNTLSDGTKAAANLLFPISEEKRLGEEMSAEIEKGLIIHTDPEVQAYVDKLGAKIISVADDRSKNIKFKFKVVDSPATLNAMALPGGWIYVYSGLILAAENEAEVIGVIGHEVAHVTQRHIAESLVTANGIGAIQKLILGQNNQLLTSIVTDAVTNGYLLKYSRDNESDADAVGTEYVIKAGYNPRGLISFFKKIQALSKTPEMLSSHPDPGNRIKATEDRISGRSNMPTFNGDGTLKAIQERLKK